MPELLLTLCETTNQLIIFTATYLS